MAVPHSRRSQDYSFRITSHPVLLTFQLLLGVAVRLAVLVCHWTKRTRKEEPDMNFRVRNRPQTSRSGGVFGELCKQASQILLNLMW